MPTNGSQEGKRNLWHECQPQSHCAEMWISELPGKVIRVIFILADLISHITASEVEQNVESMLLTCSIINYYLVERRIQICQ